MTTRFSGVAICLTSVVFAGPVFADIDMSFDGMYLHQEVTRSYVFGDAWDSPQRQGGTRTMAGILSFNDGDLLTLCMELKQTASHSVLSYQANSFGEFNSQVFDRSLVLASLFDQYWEQTISSGSKAMASAFAMVTWEVMLEGFSFPGTSMFDQISIDKGAVQFSGVSNQSLAYYQEMTGNLYIADSSDGLVAYVHPQHQDQVGVVPAPSVLALLGIAGLRRRRRRG